MQIGEGAPRAELSLRTIPPYQGTRLGIPAAPPPGGFRPYTPADVARLMVIRRMKPLGFSLDEMRDLLAATDRLDALDALDSLDDVTGDASGEAGDDVRAHLLARVRDFEQATLDR